MSEDDPIKIGLRMKRPPDNGDYMDEYYGPWWYVECPDCGYQKPRMSLPMRQDLVKATFICPECGEVIEVNIQHG